MGQKSNINSLRLLTQPNLSNNRIKLNLLEITIVKYLRFLFLIKGIQISKTYIGFTNNKIYIYLKIFYGTQRIVRYKKYKTMKSNPVFFGIQKILKAILKLSKNNILEIKVINVNKKIDTQLIRQTYIMYKKHLNNLFDKKFYMCIDITKITVLFLSNKIETKIFLEHLGKVFSGIHKKNHLRYFKLIETQFEFLIINSIEEFKILGLKLQVSGKLLGKAIASKQLITRGSIPTQTLNKNISFEKTHIYTVYGVFGFKFWTYRNNI